MHGALTASTGGVIRRLVRAVVLAVIALATVSLIAFAGKPAEKDYISYWSAGRQLVHHANPYAVAEVLSLEKREGYPLARPLVMRNPPWALFVTVPLGYMNARAGLVFWMVAAVSAVAIFLWQFRVRPQDRMLAFCFAPVFGSLAAGQSSPFLLLGVSTFLAFYRSRPVLAGAGLLFMAFKPHLFLLIWAVLLVDGIRHRRGRLLGGFALAFMAAWAVALSFDSNVASQYLSLVRDAGLQDEFVPTPSSLVRVISGVMGGTHASWLQLAPSALALVWAGWFYWSRREGWEWKEHAGPLLLVGLWASPYVWMTDEIVLLPVLLTAVLRPGLPRGATAALVAINGVLLLMFAAQIQPSTGAYLWTSTAWLGWYIYSRRDAPARVEVHMPEHTPALPAHG